MFEAANTAQAPGEKRSSRPSMDDQGSSASVDFRVPTTIGLSIASVIAVGPFGINHLVAGRWTLGVLSLVASAALVANGLQMFLHGRNYRLMRLSIVPICIASLVIIIQNQGIIGVLWSFPAILLFFATLEEIEAWPSNAILLCAVFWTMQDVIDLDIKVRAIATLSLVFVFSGVFVRAISWQHKRLSLDVITDPLTKMRNRRVLAPTLTKAMKRSRETQAPVSLLYIDLDHFKRINDEHGHAVGDQVLRASAQTMLEECRDADSGIRTGGEEFVLLLTNAVGTEAVTRAESLRTKMNANAVLQRYEVTASIGVAELEPQDLTWEHWLVRADNMLYTAKLAGRNRVMLALKSHPA